MTNIYSLNSLVNGTRITLCETKQNFYLYQNSNFIFIKKSITSFSKIKLYLYKISNDIINKISNFIYIKNQILSSSKIKIYLCQKLNFIFIKIKFLSLII